MVSVMTAHKVSSRENRCVNKYSLRITSAAAAAASAPPHLMKYGDHVLKKRSTDAEESSVRKGLRASVIITDLLTKEI